MWLILGVLIILSCSLFSNEFIDYQLRDLTIRHYPGDEKLVNELGPQILDDIDRFQKTIGFYPDIQAVIIVSPDKQYYASLTSGYSGIIEFSEAFYSSSAGKIYIRNPRDLRDYSRLRKIILHEYIHLFIDSVFSRVPLWFHEGMAVYFSEGISFDRQVLFAKDHVLGNTEPLTEMREGYPESRARWQSFYTKSALALQYLYSNHKDNFFRLWELSEEIESFDSAFLQAFGMTTMMFSNQFEEHLKERFRIEILLSFTGFLWSLLPLILLVAYIRKRIKARRLRSQWENDFCCAQEKQYVDK